MKTSDIEGLGLALFAEAGDALILFDPDTDRCSTSTRWPSASPAPPRRPDSALPTTYWFRSAGPTKQAPPPGRNVTSIFHAQDGFRLRTRQAGVWIPVNVTIARLHLRPKTLALITARDMREQQ